MGCSRDAAWRRCGSGWANSAAHFPPHCKMLPVPLSAFIIAGRCVQPYWKLCHSFFNDLFSFFFFMNSLIFLAQGTLGGCFGSHTVSISPFQILIFWKKDSKPYWSEPGNCSVSKVDCTLKHAVLPFALIVILGLTRVFEMNTLKYMFEVMYRV